MPHLLTFLIICTTETCSYKQVKNYKMFTNCWNLLFSLEWKGFNNQNSYSRGNRSRKEEPLLLANLAIIPKSELVFYMNINWVGWRVAAGEVKTAACSDAKFLWFGECTSFNPRDRSVWTCDSPLFRMWLSCPLCLNKLPWQWQSFPPSVELREW